jgi:hypothetical protein
MLTMKFVPLIAVVVLALMPSRASAQNDEHYKDQVVGYLNQSELVKELRSYNFVPIETKVGYIVTSRNEAQNAVFELKFGFVYAFVGACDEDCRSLNFVLYDNTGVKVVEDNRGKDEPAITFLPPRGGTYTIRAEIPRCGGLIGCYWGVQILGK